MIKLRNGLSKNVKSDSVMSGQQNENKLFVSY